MLSLRRAFLKQIFSILKIEIGLKFQTSHLYAKINTKERRFIQSLEKNFPIGISEFKESRNNLLSRPAAFFTPLQWLHIYKLIFKSGDFSSALKFRMRAVDCAQEKLGLGATKKICRSTLALGLESEFFTDQKHFQIYIQNASISRREKKRFFNLASIWFFEQKKDPSLTLPSIEARKFLNNKKVLLIGPISSLETDVRQNRCCNVHAYLNFFEESNNLGGATNRNMKKVIFYNKNKVNLRLKSKELIIPTDANLLIFKDKEHIKQTRNLFPEGVKADYLINSLACAYGTHRLLTRVLVYLILCRPKEIKLIGFDLNTSNSVREGYIFKELAMAVGETNFDRLLNNVDSHDLLSDFFLLRRMFRLKLFECDDTLAEILSLKPGEYFEKLGAVS